MAQPCYYMAMIYKRARRAWYTHSPNCSCNNCFKSKWKQGRKKSKHKPIDYFEYIRSEAWYERRAKHLKKHGSICKACGSPHNIQVHHMEYGNWGNEPDYALVTLCGTCHKDFHSKHDTRHNMIKATELYIKHKQNTIRQYKTS